MASALDLLANKRAAADNEIKKYEKQIEDAESVYLQADYSQSGNVLKGFEGFLASKDLQRKRTRTLKDEERAFSLSSRTSAVAHRLELQQAEALENAQHPTVRSGKVFGQKAFAQKVPPGKMRRG
ncbi:hypothetical protein WJX74_008182 [Apatococcus lobatus]|uniref:Chromatin modification-related protein MEAF6 n=1 Tax=Apatococcus lobatus TaxID=904363 RepID=A0AAW1QV35_9CHLO